MTVQSSQHAPWCAPECPAATSGMHSSRPVLIGRDGDAHRLRVRMWSFAHLTEPVPSVEIVIDGGNHTVRVDLSLAAAHDLVGSLAELLTTVRTHHRQGAPR